MPYSLLKFEQESVPVGTEMRDVFVAVIKADDSEQPFRVTIENIADKETALGEVNAWIAAREHEDVLRVQNAVKDEENRQKAALLGELNAGITN